MAKGFGIAALVCAIVAIFVPVVGIFVSGIAIILAVIAALAGDKIFATATPVIAGVNTFFMSPSVWMAMGGAGNDRQAFVTVILIGLAAPFVAMILNASGKLAIKS